MSEDNAEDVQARAHRELNSRRLDFGKSLQEACSSKGLTERRIASQINVSPRVVRGWFRGTVLPHEDDLAELCILLDLELEAMLEKIVKVVSAERTVYIVDQALARQSLVLNQIAQLNETTANLKRSTESAQKAKRAAFYKRQTNRGPNNAPSDVYGSNYLTSLREDQESPGDQATNKSDSRDETAGRVDIPARSAAEDSSIHEPTAATSDDVPEVEDWRVKMSKIVVAHRPRVFIGSSSEGMNAARALQVLLDHECEVEIWNQGTFEVGRSTLESLVSATERFDFAILIASADDTTVSRGNARLSARDNVIFELGLFMGALGSGRTFMVQDRTNPASVPSDLAGVTPATFAPHSTGNTEAALGPAATQILRAIQILGLKNFSK